MLCHAFRINPFLILMCARNSVVVDGARDERHGLRAVVSL